jgi:uncharacterized protein (DUF1697 family)
VNRFVALLRGINVGGNNMIPMTALRACFEKQRLRDVATYIQSGNVLFCAASADAAALSARLERALAGTFGFPVPVVLRSDVEMTAIVHDAPAGFGDRPTEYRYDVIFLKAPLTAGEALPEVPTKPGVDRVWPGEGVLYFARLDSRAAESQLPRFAGKPIYKRVTVRNWNTTRKLADLLARETSS